MVGKTLFVGGDFRNIGWQPRIFLAVLDMTTGNALGWNPNVDNSVYILTANKTTVYAARYFSTIGGKNRTFTGMFGL
jgi:hypothetical protein